MKSVKPTKCACNPSQLLQRQKLTHQYISQCQPSTRTYILLRPAESPSHMCTVPSHPPPSPIVSVNERSTASPNITNRGQSFAGIRDLRCNRPSRGEASYLIDSSQSLMPKKEIHRTQASTCIEYTFIPPRTSHCAHTLCMSDVSGTQTKSTLAHDQPISRLTLHSSRHRRFHNPYCHIRPSCQPTITLDRPHHPYLRRNAFEVNPTAQKSSHSSIAYHRLRRISYDVTQSDDVHHTALPTGHIAASPRSTWPTTNQRTRSRKTTEASHTYRIFCNR